MSNKVKGVASLGSGLITSAGPRQITSLTRPRISPASSGRPLIPNPDEPGCSRWFSCTPSHSTMNHRTFFSSNSDSHVHPMSRNPKTLLSAGTHAAERPLSPASESTPPFVSTSHIDRTPHLPLPPTLPYSPNSHPFRRHLDILSLALYSSPDESWSIYSALHPSLRSYIPDEVFRNLLSHQVDHTEQARAWHRTKVLLRLAKKCDMDLSDLGLDNIYKCLRAGMRRSRVEKDEKKLAETERIVTKLWSTVEGMVSDLGRVPHDVRRHRLGLQHRQLLRLQRRPPSNIAELRLKIEESTLGLIRRGGGSGLGHYIAEVLSISRGRSVEGLRQSLRLLAGCMAQGIEIKPSHLLKLMRQLSSRWSQQGEDGLEMVREEISILLNELRIEPLSTTARDLYHALDIATRRSRTRVEKALDLLERNELNLGGVIARGVSVALAAKDLQPVDSQVQALDAALQLLEAALKHREGSYGPLISAITIALYRARTSPRTSVRTSVDEIDERVVRFVRMLHDAQIIPLLPSEAIVPLFRLILTTATSSQSNPTGARSTESYILCRKIYQHARSASPPFQWSTYNLSLWRKLFKVTLTPPKLHLHFASRLYTDLLADGIPIRRTDALMMIRSIGLKSSPSRPILLERHIKDYLWTELDPHPARQPTSLILALVQGLTTVGGTKDAGLALALAERLAEEKSLQPVVVKMVIGQLSKSSKKQDRIRCFQLLRKMSATADHATGDPQTQAQTVWNYNTVLSHLVSSARSHPNPQPDDPLILEVHPTPASASNGNLSRPETLSHAVSLYGEMLRSGIRPNARTISTMLRSLLDNNYIDASLAIFHASIEKKILLKSNAVGRLMVRLALDDRLEEADQVELAWRGISDAGNGTGRAWDKGVVGARVLMNVKRGKEVNLEDVMQKHGWKGSESFLSFLNTLKPPKPKSGQQVAREASKDTHSVEEHLISSISSSTTDSDLRGREASGVVADGQTGIDETSGYVNGGKDNNRTAPSSSAQPGFGQGGRGGHSGDDRVDMCSTSGWNMMVSF
ncbi:hypothetical protein IAU59_003544 [Kwoniella sp. CBS 9459]